MKNMYILKYLTGLLIAICIASCESNDQSFLTMKDANVYFDTDQSRFVPSVSENNQTLKVPLILAGIPGTYPITIMIETDTTGLANPAIEGIDFTIKKKEITFEEGYGTKYVEIQTIDNLVKNGMKQITLKIAGSSKPLKNNIKNSIIASILDDEHPLQYLFGTYRTSGLDVFEVDKIDKFNMIMSADPDDDAMVLIEGIPAIPQIRIKMKVNMETKQCWIVGGQTVAENDPMYGRVMLCGCFRKEDGYLGFNYEDVPGTISEDGTQFKFINWVGAVVVQEGQYYGAAFFAYKDMTLVKAK